MAKTLMVVANTMPHINYLIYKKLVKTPYIALPNILAGRLIVPECIQKQATTDKLVIKMREQLNKLACEVFSSIVSVHSSFF